MTLDKTKQVVDFSFIKRYREYFQKCHEPTLEDDTDLESYQRVP